ncbi:MAG: DUF2259 domain-containing protein [Spirochaetaceae bacterium]|jgi:predicted secreted protein|nr:DUF2259 domain-containing protein [Spirochaetaceae bacterium]
MIRRKLYSLVLFAGLAASPLTAGDVASFVDLGFSDDGGTYIFAQYGVEEKTLYPWADLFIVNVPKNDFVPNGRFRYTHNIPIGPVQDGSGALMHLISNNASMTKQYRLDFLTKGIPLFLSLQNGQNPAGETIEFRDFRHDLFYRAELVPSFDYSNGGLRSSFYINLHRTDKNGATRSFRVGTPSVRRDKITSYTIKRVLINPKNTDMIFVIEMTRERSKNEGDGPDIRYMVEALKL